MSVLDRYRNVLKYEGYVEPNAERWSLPPSLVYAVIDYESGGNPAAMSSQGACGLMQVLPTHFGPGQSCVDPGTNIAVGTRYLADRRAACGSLRGAIIGYFTGGCVDRGQTDALGTNPSTYVAQVESRWKELSAAGIDATSRRECLDACYEGEASNLAECLSACPSGGGFFEEITTPGDVLKTVKDLLDMAPEKAKNAVLGSSVADEFIKLLPILGAISLGIILVVVALIVAIR